MQGRVMTSISAHGITLQTWEELPFHDFLVNRLAILEIEGEDGKPGSAVILCIDYQPGFFVDAHKHRTGHVELIVDGSVRVGDQWERKGDIRVVPAGVSYGPIQAGDEGCKAMEFFADRKDILPMLDDRVAAAQQGGDAAELRARLARLLNVDAD
jgi:hypothetical protein